MQFLLLALLMVISAETAADDIPCWLNPETQPKISSLAVLKTFLLPVRLDEPEDDAKIRAMHGDYRLLAVIGIVFEYPGVEDKSMICALSKRVVYGTSDAIESKEHSSLMRKVWEYAQKYNVAMQAIVAKNTKSAVDRPTPPNNAYMDPSRNPRPVAHHDKSE